MPQGNPDRLPTRHANVWLRYPIVGVDSLSPDAYESVHAGFDTTFANADPNRLVPLDAARAPRSASTRSARCTTSSTRRAGSTRRSPPQRVTGRRSRRICVRPRWAR